MKKAVIKIKVEYDHSYMFDDMQVINAIEGIGSNIVTLINNPGSPLWLNFGAQATVNAIGSNVYVDRVDMPLPDVLKQQWQEGGICEGVNMGQNDKSEPQEYVVPLDKFSLYNKPKDPNDELWERVKNAAHGEWVAIDPESKVSGFIRYAKDIPDELNTMSKEYAAKTKANELDQIIKTHLGLTSNISPKRKGDMLDRYAIPAMQGLIMRDDNAVRAAIESSRVRIARIAYDQAEAMIAERNKRTQ